MDKIYDLIIIGAGPAGLAAALYAGRGRLDTLIIEKTKVGGQIVITAEIDNYPGSVSEDSGATLIGRMAAQVEHFGAKKIYDNIVDVELEGKIKHLKGVNGEYYAKAVIIATGVNPKTIGCPGEAELMGKGVSYCATCDGAFFEDFDIYVVGGGDSAVEEAIYLTRFGRKVTIIHRRDELRAVKAIQEKAFNNKKIEFIWNSVVKEVRGDGILTSMVVENRLTGETTEIVANEEDGTFGLFVFIGYEPHSKLFEGKLDMVDGYIVTDVDMKTSIPGVFAAGDIRVKNLRQVVTAAADGAIAATQAEKYLAE